MFSRFIENKDFVHFPAISESDSGIVSLPYGIYQYK